MGWTKEANTAFKYIVTLLDKLFKGRNLIMRKLVVFGLFLVTLVTVVAKGQQMHVLLVSDTADGKLDRHVKQLSKQSAGISRYLVPQAQYSLTIMEV